MSVEKGIQTVKDNFVEWAMTLVVMTILTLVCNCIGYKHTIAESIPGLLIIYAIGLAAWVIKGLLPSKLPINAYAAILAMFLANPWMPMTHFIMPYVKNVALMAIVTPVLAFAGVGVGKDWDMFKKVGPKAIIVGCIVIFSTFFWSMLIAEIGLRIQGLV